MIERKSWGAVEVEGNSGRNGTPVRRDWERAEAGELCALPFADLPFHSRTVHRDNFDPNHVESASLLSVKTGGCPEDCAYCGKGVHYDYDTGLKATRLMDRADMVAAAQHAKAAGATRFCMAAAWRSPKDRDLDQACDTIAAIKRVVVETCVTLGMLTPKQAARLADAEQRGLRLGCQTNRGAARKRSA
ncbi:biotin synthase-like enzyme [Bradyrhizobium sp. RT6a]|uniref:radical SAM protein n=1 Tax=Bradyrhizobium sp. RT6a TaxID=3156381 RepID=UPI003399B6BF